MGESDVSMFLPGWGGGVGHPPTMGLGFRVGLQLRMRRVHGVCSRWLWGYRLVIMGWVWVGYGWGMIGVWM